MENKYTVFRYCFKLLMLVCLLLHFTAYTQKRAIDSTLNILSQHMKEDSVRVNALIHLSYVYQTSNLKNSEYYAREALLMSKKINNDLLTCAALSRLGSVYTWERKTTEALATCFEQDELAQKIKSRYWLQNAYLGIGYIYEMENEWGKALSYTLQALRYEKSLDPSDKASVYNHLGAEYLGLNNDKLAEYFLRKAADLFRQVNNLDQLGDCETSLANVFATRHNYDSAEHHFNAALSLFTDLDEPYQIADVCQQVGDMYVKRGMYKRAKEYFEKTIFYYDKNDISEADYALAVLGLGTVAWGEKNYAAASEIFHEEFAKIKKAGITEPQLNYLIYMAKTDSVLGNYKEAYEHMQNYTLLYDSFYNQEKTRATQRMLVEFDVQQKEKENQQLKLQNNLQQQHIVIFAVAGIALLIAGAFLALLYKQKNAALISVKEMQQATESKKNELAIINTVKDKLISMIAHDVRSPLTSLQNTLYLTRQKILDTEEFDRLSTMLDHDIRHLVTMLDNTLLWAKEQIQALKVNKVPFDLHSLAEDVKALYNHSIQDKDLKVQNLIQPSTEVVSDKEIIHTVLRNLLSNAIKFTASGAEIEIKTEQKNGEMLVTVKDNGTGIPKDVLDKIYKREFISTRGTNNEKGTGLGLMFSFDLLSKMGEKLYIKSDQGEGTSVTFSIHKHEQLQS
ncbi:MAG TPA: tetratricopeptide repeat-containing sensor histidine kinase [Chitinophagaceae bacterium]